MLSYHKCVNDESSQHWADNPEVAELYTRRTGFESRTTINFMLGRRGADTLTDLKDDAGTGDAAAERVRPIRFKSWTQHPIGEGPNRCRTE
jgi:hypothetical protein